MQLADLDLNKSYTFADYLTWDFKERVEIIEGKLFPMNPITYEAHQRMSANISGFLWQYQRDKAITVLYAPFDVRFPDNSENDEDVINVVQPDIIVVCDETKFDDKGCLGAPDIIVEILVPYNNITEIKNKYPLYEAFGVKEYWIVSPQHHTFQVCTLVNGKYIPSRLMVEGDVITTPILPGFTLDLEDLFSRS